MFGNLKELVELAVQVDKGWDKPETQEIIDRLVSKLNGKGAKDSAKLVEEVGILARCIVEIAEEDGFIE